MGVDCGLHLHVVSISSLASESQLLDLNNLVQKEMHQVEVEPLDVGDTNELIVIHDRW